MTKKLFIQKRLRKGFPRCDKVYKNAKLDFLRETEKRDKKQAKAEAEERLKIMVRLARNLSFESQNDENREGVMETNDIDCGFSQQSNDKPLPVVIRCGFSDRPLFIVV